MGDANGRSKFGRASGAVLECRLAFLKRHWQEFQQAEGVREYIRPGSAAQNLSKSCYLAAGHDLQELAFGVTIAPGTMTNGDPDLLSIVL